MLYYEHIKQLHDSELYQDLKQLACIVLTLCDNCTETELLSLTQRYQCMIYYGNALFYLGEYTKAEDIYKRALLLRKAINKAKGKGTTTTAQSGAELTSDVEIKYKVYQCLMHMKQQREAMSVLEGISTKQRNAKINLALAKLYLRSGMDRSAITSYKEVLRECPMALEAMSGLMSLGVKATDIHALIPHGSSCDWLLQWIRGHSLITSQEYTNAITAFKLLDNKTHMKDNVYLLTSIARVLFLDGYYTQAVLQFQKAHAIDPLHLKYMDMYAFLLAKAKRLNDLQRLANQLLSAKEGAPEAWIAFGYYALETKKPVRAIYFAQKALNSDASNVEAMLLKGTGLLDVKKTQEAVLHMMAAIRLAPHRYEAYRGLIDCYLATSRLREALCWAGKALKTLGGNARTLTLYGTVVARQPMTESKAKPYFEKAMKLDPTGLEPVYLLAEILAKEKQYDKGIELLKSYLQHHSTVLLHQLLGDFLTHTGEHQEALDQYSKALRLDPSNTRAKEGMERVEKHSDMGLDNSNAFDMEVEEMENSDNEGEFEASDVESTWSETDFS